MGLLAACVLAPVAHARPGDVDPTFGVGGESLVGLDGRVAEFGLMTLQRDGSIVATATAVPTMKQSLVRLTRDGLLDPTLGKAGAVRLPLVQVVAEPLVQADGKIVVVGTQADQTPGAPWRLAAISLEPDGDPDPGFGTAGVATPPNAGRFTPFAVIQQDDGRLVLAGGDSDAKDSFALIRLGRDGSVDRTFGEGGRVTTPNGQDFGGALAVVERKDGRLLVGGTSGKQVTTPTAGYSDDAWVVRQYTSTGAVDTGFGSQGATRVELDRFWTSYLDRLLPAGDGFVGVGSSGEEAIRPTHVSLARFGSGGALDRGFGQDGLVHTQIVAEQTGRPSISSSGDAAIQRDGRVLVGGGYSDSSAFNAPSGWAVTRYRPDGSLDAGFGRGGSATSPRGLFQSVRGLGVQPDGRIVAGGTSTNCGRSIFTLVRYLAADGPDAGPAVRACAGTVEIEPDGDLPIPIQCPFVESVCNGEIAIEIPTTDLPVGRKRFKLTGGARGTTSVRAKGRALELLRKPGTRRVVAVLTARDGERHRRVTRRGLKVRSKP